MCVVSFVGDSFGQKWYPSFQQPNPYVAPIDPEKFMDKTITNIWKGDQVSKEEFEALKKEVEFMKQMLIKAKIYDEKNNEPNCEMEDKVALLKKIAELVGVDLTEVFGNNKTNNNEI